MSSESPKLNHDDEVRPSPGTATSHTADSYMADEAVGSRKEDSDMVEQTPSSTSEVSKRSWKHLLHSYRSRYGMPVQMIALALIGFFGALGHHLYYQSLHDQLVADSQWPVRFGIALAFFVKVSFIGSVEIAYRQQAWLLVKRRDFKICTVDSLFSACYNPFAFAEFHFVFEAYLAAIVALFVWLLPLSAIASPSTLTIQDGDRVRSTMCENVPMLDFTRENGFGADSEDQERAGMSYWDVVRTDQLGTYSQQSSELERMFKLSLLSFTGPVKPPNPCPSVKACTYSFDLAAPAYKCQDRREFGGNNVIAYQGSQLAPTGSLLYASYSSFDEDEGGKPLIWNEMSPSAQELGVFTEVPSFWVGWVSNTDGYNSHIAECLLHNSTTTYDVTFSGESMLVNQTAIDLGPLLLPNGSSKAPWDQDYQQFSGYYAAGHLFRAFLLGNITSDPEYGFVDNTAASQTNWFGAITGIPVSDDFAATLEGRFRDFFLSMLGDTQLHSQKDATVPCSVTETVLVWHYAPFWLALSYSLAFGLTVIAVLVGLCCFYKNGCSMNTTFSTFIVTSRSEDLDKLADGQHLGRWPICEKILDCRVRFGELVVPSTRGDGAPAQRAAFAFPSSVQNTDDPKRLV